MCLQTDDGGNVTTATVTLAVRQEHDGVTLACTASNPLLPHAPVTATQRLEVFCECQIYCNILASTITLYK